MQHAHPPFGLSRVRLPLLSFVASCCSLALPKLGFAQTPSTANRPADERPRVRVSGRELRIVFPRDTARHWGWSAPLQPGFTPRYSWRMEVDAIEGPRDLRFDVSSVPLPRAFISLHDLLSAGRGHSCSYGMATTCGETRMTGTAEHGRPVLTLRDSALISRLFALRPMSVRVSLDRPGEQSITWDSVRIEYIAPSVRPLDSATRAAALRARRRESLERFNVRRWIAGGGGIGEHMWLTVGDSAPLWLRESEARYDLISEGQRDLTDSGWVVLDPRIAQLKPSSDAASTRERHDSADGDGYVAVVSYGPPRMYVKALRPGSTTIRVRGVHGRLDAALESEVSPGVLERDVVVVRPPHRLEITPRPETLRVGQYLEARVRVYDALGESTDRVPVDLVCMGCAGSYYDGGWLTRDYYDGERPSHLWSNEPGRMTVVARLNGLADTLSLVVVDSAAASARR
jgi:hypothetical protein